MTMRGGWIWLVEIEGLARAGLTGGSAQFLITPMALTSEPWPGDSAFAGGSSGRVCDEWQDVLQPGSVTLSGMTYAPFSASPGAQTLSFSLAMPDARPEIADYFLAQAQPVAEITAAIAPTDTTITMTDTSAIAAGDVLYIGAECFRVASVDSGTVVTIATAIIGASSGEPASDWLAWQYAIEGNVGDRSTAGAVGIIGAIGSRIAQHDVPDPNDPPPWPDTRVYLTNTRVKGRRVYLRRVSWGQDANGAYGYREQLIGQFLITGSQIGSDSTTVTVTASSLVASYDKAQLGARGVSDRLRVVTGRNGAPTAVIEPDPSFDADSRRIWRDNTCAAYATSSEAALLVGLGVTTPTPGGVIGLGFVSSRTLGLKQFPQAEETVLDVISQVVDDKAAKAVKEVLLSDPLLVSRDTTGLELLYPPIETSHPYYSTDKPGGAGILTHPLHLMLAHLGQLDSNLPYHWQLRLDTSAVATDTILAVAQSLTVTEWPGVCAVGPVKAMEWLCETFLRPLGCGWVVDEYGRLSVGAITIPRLSPWASPNISAGTDAVPAVTVAAVQMGRGVQRIVEAEAGVTQSQTGQGLGKEPRLTIQSADAWRVPDGDPESSTFLLNAMGALAPDDSVNNTAAVDLPSVAFVRTVTSTIGTYLRGGSIQYTLTVPSGYTDEDEQYQPFPALGPAMPSRYALPGSAVTVDDIPGLRKPAGRRLCIVMGHQWVDDCTAQTLRLLDAGGAVRVAAAGRVVSASEVDGMLEVVLEPAFEVSPTPYVAPPFGSVTEDGETLTAFASTVGEFEYVRFCDETLVEQGTGSEQVDSYDTATNTLTTSFNEGYIPVAGDFVLFSAVSDVDDVFAFVGRDRFNL